MVAVVGSEPCAICLGVVKQIRMRRWACSRLLGLCSAVLLANYASEDLGLSGKRPWCWANSNSLAGQERRQRRDIALSAVDTAMLV